MLAILCIVIGRYLMVYTTGLLGDIGTLMFGCGIVVAGLWLIGLILNWFE